MWTKQQTEMYRQNTANGKILANEFGEKWAKELAANIRPDTRDDAEPWTKTGIGHNDLPLAIEPLISASDFGYDSFGYVFQNMIDLYIGRKCGKIIHLLVESAKRLHEKGCKDRDSAHDGAGSDHWYWASYTPKSVYMRLDTQSFHYTINLTQNACEEWELTVEEKEESYLTGGKKKKTETIQVLQYKSFGKPFLTEPQYQIDDKEAKNAWANLAPISRFLNLVNPVCTSLGIDLYDVQFNPDKVEARAREERTKNMREAKEAAKLAAKKEKSIEV